MSKLIVKTGKRKGTAVITTPPTKTSYFAGQKFNPAGMVVTITYDDSSTEIISSFDYSEDNCPALTVDNTTIDLIIIDSSNNVYKLTQALTVRTLADTTWTMASTLNTFLPQGQTYYITSDFQSASITSIGNVDTSGSGYQTVLYVNGWAAITMYNRSGYWQPAASAGKDFHITGGEDVDDPTLVAWFLANGALKS